MTISKRELRKWLTQDVLDDIGEGPFSAERLGRWNASSVRIRILLCHRPEQSLDIIVSNELYNRLERGEL